MLLSSLLSSSSLSTSSQGPPNILLHTQSCESIRNFDRRFPNRDTSQHHCEIGFKGQFSTPLNSSVIQSCRSIALGYKLCHELASPIRQFLGLMRLYILERALRASTARVIDARAVFQRTCAESMTFTTSQLRHLFERRRASWPEMRLYGSISPRFISLS